MGSFVSKTVICRSICRTLLLVLKGPAPKKLPGGNFEPLPVFSLPPRKTFRPNGTSCGSVEPRLVDTSGAAHSRLCFYQEAQSKMLAWDVLSPMCTFRQPTCRRAPRHSLLLWSLLCGRSGFRLIFTTRRRRTSRTMPAPWGLCARRAQPLVSDRM